MFLTKTRLKRILSTVALIAVMALSPATVAHAVCADGQDTCAGNYGVSGATFNSGGALPDCQPTQTYCYQAGIGDLAAGLIGQSYVDAVKADSPVGFWRLGESSGTTATDASGNGRNGTYAGTYKLKQPSLVRSTDTSAWFNGSSGSHVSIAANAAFRVATTNQLAVEFWYKGTQVGATGGAGPTGLVTSNTASGNKQWVIGLDASGHVVATAINSGGTYVDVIGTSVVNDDEPHYIAVNYDKTAATVAIYVDGLLDNSGSVGSIGDWGTPPVTIGENTRAAGSKGTFDEVAIYSSKLTATQIAKHYYTAFSAYQAQVGSVNTSTPYLEMSVGTPAVDVGVLKSNETHVGTATFSVKSYLAQGYQVTTNSPGPQNGSYTMNLINPSGGGAAGTEGFGMNLVANTCPANSSFSGTGNCSGGVGADPAQQPDSTFSYGYASTNYDTPGQYYYSDGDIIAQSNSSSGFTSYTLSYIFNISGVTPGGTYTMDQSLVTTSTF